MPNTRSAAPKRRDEPAGTTNLAVQSSIPGLSIAEIRAILSEQRKVFQEKGIVSWTDIVTNGMTRMEFNYRYVKGIARKRFAKHQRASNRNGSKAEDDEYDLITAL